MVGTGPVWPPPSWPCAMTRVDAPAGHLLGVAALADGRHGDDAAVLEPLDQVAARGLREARDLDAFADHELHALVDVGLVGAQVDAEGPVVRALTSAMAARSCGSVIVAEARMPSPPASLVAAVSRAPATQPMPVCTIGWRMPKSWQMRVSSAPPLRAPPALCARA